MAAAVLLYGVILFSSPIAHSLALSMTPRVVQLGRASHNTLSSSTVLFNDKYTYSWGGFGGSHGEINDSFDLPPQSANGIYQVKSERQYQVLLQSFPDKLVIIKFYASYCQACRALGPKFIAVKEDPQLQNLPIIWADYESSRNNKELFQQLNVLTLPTVHFYDGSRGLIENFPCGPAKIPLLKKKLARFINQRVDAFTRQLMQPPVVKNDDQPVAPRMSRDIVVDNELITPEHIYYLKDDLPFFRDLTDMEFKTMLSKAKLLTFNPGDLIIRQGMPGRTFYVLKSGVAEMSVRSKFDDPISTPSNYLGVVVNELKKFDYFGERALTTGEPLKASVRALEKVRCFAFDVDDIPESSILSKKRRATQDIVDKLNRRYELPADYTSPYTMTQRDDCILELLVRFRQIRQAAKCFEYVMNTKPKWGDSGEIARRTMLVNKLSPSQREEFEKVFDIVDVNHCGKISLLEMRRFMDSARQTKSNEELQAMIARASSQVVNGDYAISRDEFMGVMAEAEFYNLFTETFQMLDKENTGYVRAGDLDEILGGVRGLISDNPTNIIDVEDKDMLVDYEQFSKMLLGAAL
jgi:Ca2+-binding EF-hand superfamily protein/CRP-like cAMP-binding protein/thiol-disulfide isomerase/thioredoxin